MTASNQVRGLWVPALTPFDTDLSVDPARFIAHCQWLLNNGANGLAAFGTTSEANSLSKEERKSLLEALIDGGIAPGQLMPGDRLLRPARHGRADPPCRGAGLRRRAAAATLLLQGRER